MTDRQSRRAPPPLDNARLEELALRYVGRFATTRAKLQTYLHRKVRERGWADDRPLNVAAICDRFVERGYVDDAGYALSKSRALTGRGYGKARIAQALRAAGIEELDSAEARRHADERAVQSALRFAERKRAGPFASERPDRPARERLIAAFVRAGHPFALARAILELEPGGEVHIEEIGANLRGKGTFVND